MVKTFILLTLLVTTNASLAQTPLPVDDALKQMYSEYDPTKQQAHWVCSDDQKSADSAKREGWPCSEGEIVAVSVLSISQIEEGNVWKTYVVTSAVPAQEPHEFECHACVPAVGVEVLAWKAGHWELEGANAAVGFYGEWGIPATSELVAIGPEKHGVILSSDWSGQGYHNSTKFLVAGVEKGVTEVWRLNDETDDSGAFDPKGKNGPSRQYYAEAAFKFVYDGKDDIYEIIVMSRGRDSKGSANWTAVYRFRDGKYQLLKKTRFSELPHSTARTKAKQ